MVSLHNALLYRLIQKLFWNNNVGTCIRIHRIQTLISLQWIKHLITGNVVSKFICVLQNRNTSQTSRIFWPKIEIFQTGKIHNLNICTNTICHVTRFYLATLLKTDIFIICYDKHSKSSTITWVFKTIIIFL